MANEKTLPPGAGFFCGLKPAGIQKAPRNAPNGVSTSKISTYGIPVDFTGLFAILALVTHVLEA
ncbi:MAG: hypothetical protein JSU74_12870 [Candidatus Zixiibacteriota bacterium]|nr:MAG: hypothetical protein JSU74_12870 [candidate division Zixibacteria bacterium]